MAVKLKYCWHNITWFYWVDFSYVGSKIRVWNSSENVDMVLICFMSAVCYSYRTNCRFMSYSRWPRITVFKTVLVQSTKPMSLFIQIRLGRYGRVEMDQWTTLMQLTVVSYSVTSDKCKKTVVYTHVNGDSHIENSKNHKKVILLSSTLTLSRCDDG